MQNKMYINGQWRFSADGCTSDIINPATEKSIQSVPVGTQEDMNQAVIAARNAFDKGPWRDLSGSERASFMRAMADEIEARTDELAALEVANNGKPLPEAVWDIEDTAGCFRYYADLAEKLDQDAGQAIELGDPRFSSVAVREPIGVAGAIVPWNFPMLMAAWKLAPALAAGCTIVLKPAEITPLTALEFGKISDKVGLPAGVLNIVTGRGSVIGQCLTEHPDVDKVAFTGSGPVGSGIMKAAARDVKNITLELGGKSPFIIFGDSDIERAVEWIMFGVFWNKGEVCSATSRVLIEENIYEAVLQRLIEECEKITIGQGMDDGVLMGPAVSRNQYDQVLKAIDRGLSDGARIATGGGRPEGFDKGFFIQPTVFTDMAEDSWIWKEEIFGPVVCLKSFKTEDEAIRLANNSRFGLAAAVMSMDDSRCERVARAFRAGIVWINCSQPTFTQAPWGGYKQSGLGRELGPWGLNNYLETKQITRFNSDEPWGWYIK